MVDQKQNYSGIALGLMAIGAYQSAGSYSFYFREIYFRTWLVEEIP
jgi:NADH:ubiquinone oxidoreductase subunit H